MKIFLSLLLLAGILSAEPYRAWDFQNLEDYVRVQQMHEIHERAKDGNKGNYNFAQKVTQFYISGGMSVDHVDGIQSSTNIGNYTEIQGDNNHVHQDSGEQSNENTIN